jgi:DNA-binding NtrC family response regulator
MSRQEPTQPTSAAAPFEIVSRPGRLRVQVEDGPTLEANLTHGTTVTFGRSRSADFVIDHDSISKLHFSLRVVNDGIELTDLGSKNGTWYCTRPVRQITLMPQDEFWAGGCKIKLLGVGDIKVEVAEQPRLGRLFGESVAMREFFAHILRLAPSPIDLLLGGETGTGKELTARTIHEVSERADGPFVVLDCSTLPETLADATIFGFRRGAFTGAEHDQAGLFEQADGGTLFIDEVGELDLPMQRKFLRAIDNRQVTRLGEPGVVRDVDVRIVAASNRDLAAEVRAGRFREDLFHRLGQPELRLPALRERGLDVIALAEHFLAELGNGKPPPEIADDARTLLMTHDWPGNVRELKAAIVRAGLTCSNAMIRAENIDLARRGGWAHKLAKVIDDRGAGEYKELHMMVDRVYLPRMLGEHKTLSATAEHLGLQRAWLRKRLRELGLYDVGEG